MRRVHQAIHVEADSQGQPQRLRWGPNVRAVTEVVDTWDYGGDWWRGQPGRTYYRLSLSGGDEVVIYREDDTARWMLALSMD